MLTRVDVVKAYVTLLGRAPESEEVITSHCAAHDAIDSLTASIQDSEEYRIRQHTAGGSARDAETPRTITREQVINAYRDLLRRKPESDAVVDSQVAGHRTIEEFEASVRSSQEFKNLQVFSMKRKIQWHEIDSEVANIHRLLGEDPGGEYQRALTDFWLEIPAITAHPEAEEYRRWVMETYGKISGRTSYSVSSEETDYDLESYVRRPAPYAGGSSEAIGDMLMAIGHVIRVMGLKPEASVLEFGFGWGNTTVQLAMSGYQVTGIDIAPNFVEMVRRRTRALNLEADLRVGSFFDAETIDQQFDAVLFFECFHHCDDHIRLLKALPRILKPGGKLVLAGETINNALPYPWGVNPDSQAIYCIRQFGWLELSFRENYILDLLDRLGWKVEKHNFLNAMGVTYIATRTPE
jgi:2-polyprenyl-3-methyl-5-hydroxy-6-metoxy-1,4-benzoquinol methylase